LRTMPLTPPPVIVITESYPDYLFFNVVFLYRFVTSEELCRDKQIKERGSFQNPSLIQ